MFVTKAPRAWYRPLGVLIQPESVESINFETKVIGVYMEMDGRGFHRLRLNDFDLMWPAGIKDKNGKEYSSGDIIKVNKLTFESSSPLPENLIVRFYGGMFQLFRNNEPLMGLHLGYIADGEVIGNIYENTELLAPKEGAENHG